VDLAAQANISEAPRSSYSLLTINGGSSSIRFALFDVGVPLRRRLDGKVDRIGLSGTNLTFKDATGQSQSSHTIDAGNRHSASAFYWIGSKRSRRSLQSKP
jgi:acetate kinase